MQFHVGQVRQRCRLRLSQSCGSYIYLTTDTPLPHPSTGEYPYPPLGGSASYNLARFNAFCLRDRFLFIVVIHDRKDEEWGIPDGYGIEIDAVAVDYFRDISCAYIPIVLVQ